MNINLIVKYADGTDKAVEAVAPDLVAFESKFDLSIARLEKEVKLTHLLYLAWHVEKRTGAIKDEFEKWVETVAMVTAEEPKK